jgi:hypothetical protein
LDAEFYVRKPVIEREMYESIHRQIEKGKSTMYPIRQTQLTTYQLRKGTTIYWSEPSAFKVMPDFICFGIVPVTSYFGALDKSYNNFKPFDLKNIRLLGGEKPIVYDLLELDYEKGQYAVAYNSICQLVQQHGGGNDITLHEYTKGNVLYAFNTSRINSEMFHLDTNGVFKFSLNFGGTGLAEDATLIMMCQSQKLMEIGRDKSVTVA